MSRLELVEAVPVPGGGELRLFRRGDNGYSIRLVGGGELMNTHVHGSEDKLAELTCPLLRADARVLIGGLGIGYTLAAALRTLGPQATVVVAELVPAVVRWHRELYPQVSGRPLDDARAAVREQDVGEVMREQAGAWDAILLDVDNGPEGLTRRSNDALYSPAGLASAHAALRSGGVLAVWSASPDARFTRRLREAGFQVEELPVRAHGNRGARHFIWRARRR